MNSYTMQQYLDAGCNQLGIRDLVASALYNATGGKVCDTGCPYFKEGNCEAYKNLTRRVTAKPAPTETVKQEAARLGVSINEVRRRRNAGDQP